MENLVEPVQIGHGWQRNPQEYERGDYYFDGVCKVTVGIQNELPEHHLAAIILDAKLYAKKGIDYLLVYEHEDYAKVFVIDQVCRAHLEEGLHPTEHHYFTVLFAHEY